MDIVNGRAKSWLISLLGFSTVDVGWDLVGYLIYLIKSEIILFFRYGWVLSGWLALEQGGWDSFEVAGILLYWNILGSKENFYHRKDIPEFASFGWLFFHRCQICHQVQYEYCRVSIWKLNIWEWKVKSVSWTVPSHKCGYYGSKVFIRDFVWFEIFEPFFFLLIIKDNY